jgi:hypothetical protein
MTIAVWTGVALWLGLNAGIAAWHWHIAGSAKTIAVSAQNRRRHR